MLSTSITRSFNAVAAFLLMSSALPADEAKEFSLDVLRQMARARAAAPYVEPPDALDSYWKNLTYDQHRDIRFQMEKGLWSGQDRGFSIDYFHPGWTAKRTVTVSEVIAGKALPAAFDRSLFDYGKQQVPESVPPPPGYAGWRARYPLNGPDYMDEFLVFLGASYFRTIPAKAPYGLSARGISMNSGLPGVPEEFPDFQSFWVERPEKGAKSLKAWALLDGPSVAGAYQFTITPGPETVMDIDVEITLRRPVQQLGLAPFSSMFWFGELTHPRPLDFRPEVHDSDCLLMELSTGGWHLRPFDTTAGQSRHCVFALENPRSWSVLQRDRSFSSYQDLEAHYHDRPSVRVEPMEGFEKGKLHLIELPSPDETNDNIVLVYEPDPKPEPGKAFHYRYRLRWMRDPQPHGLFAVKATRWGTPVQKPDQLLFTVDFAKPLHPEKKTGEPKWDDLSLFKPVVTIGEKSAKLIHAGLTDISMANVDDLPLGMGRSPDVHMPQVLRAFFVIEPPPGMTSTELTCELQDAKAHAVSERWVYLWQK